MGGILPPRMLSIRRFAYVLCMCWALYLLGNYVRLLKERDTLPSMLKNVRWNSEETFASIAVVVGFAIWQRPSIIQSTFLCLRLPHLVYEYLGIDSGNMPLRPEEDPTMPELIVATPRRKERRSKNGTATASRRPQDLLDYDRNYGVVPREMLERWRTEEWRALRDSLLRMRRCSPRKLPPVRYQSQ